jgi:hypothetical protein
MNTKFEYGELYDIHPTYGIDIQKGSIQIVGILNSQALPNWICPEEWETGNADFDYDLIILPWYAFQYCEDDNDEVSYLPQFALEEVIRKANIEKVKEWKRKNQIVNSIILG